MDRGQPKPFSPPPPPSPTAPQHKDAEDEQQQQQGERRIGSSSSSRAAQHRRGAAAAAAGFSSASSEDRSASRVGAGSTTDHFRVAFGGAPSASAAAERQQSSPAIVAVDRPLQQPLPQQGGGGRGETECIRIDNRSLRRCARTDQDDTIAKRATLVFFPNTAADQRCGTASSAAAACDQTTTTTTDNHGRRRQQQFHTLQRAIPTESDGATVSARSAVDWRRGPLLYSAVGSVQQASYAWPSSDFKQDATRLYENGGFAPPPLVNQQAGERCQAYRGGGGAPLTPSHTLANQSPLSTPHHGLGNEEVGRRVLYLQCANANPSHAEVPLGGSEQQDLGGGGGGSFSAAAAAAICGQLDTISAPGTDTRSNRVCNRNESENSIGKDAYESCTTAAVTVNNADSLDSGATVATTLRGAAVSQPSALFRGVSTGTAAAVFTTNVDSTSTDKQRPTTTEKNSTLCRGLATKKSPKTYVHFSGGATTTTTPAPDCSSTAQSSTVTNSKCSARGKHESDRVRSTRAQSSDVDDQRKLSSSTQPVAIVGLRRSKRNRVVKRHYSSPRAA